MIAAVLLAILSVCSMAQTVEVTVPLASVTQADAPVQLTGMITALEDSATGHYEYRPKVTAKNGSPKDACLLALEINATGLIQSPFLHRGLHDYFFGKDLLLSGEEDKIQLDFALWGKLESNVTSKAAPPDASANLKLLFVQFNDGSTWGDSAVAAKTLKDRQAAFDAMKSLLATYQLKGEREFIAALLQEPSLTAIEVIRHVYHPENNNVGEVLQKLATGLRNAQQHQGCL